MFAAALLTLSTLAAPPQFCDATAVRDLTVLGPRLVVRVEPKCGFTARVRFVSDLGGVVPVGARGYYSISNGWPRAVSFYFRKCTWAPERWDGSRWLPVPVGGASCEEG